MSAPTALPPEVIARIKKGFFEECEELLAELESGLVALKNGARDPERINTVFRAAHSIKGGAASFGLDALVRFAHRMESVLAAVRSGALPLDNSVLDLLLKAADMLADHVHAAREEREAASDAASAVPFALDDLLRRSGLGGQETPAVSAATMNEIPASATRWSIKFRPHAALYAHANEPLTLLRELERLGSVAVSLNDDDLPALEDLNPEDSYLLWTVALTSTRTENDIRAVFEFVEGDCDIAIAPADDLPTFASRPEADGNTVPVLAPQAIRSGLSQTIRVNLNRMDRLVDLVSELVITQSMLTQRLGAAGAATALGGDLALDELNRLTRELQDSVMAIRAQPVKVVFQRMLRLVREMEELTGKDVDLVFEGETTEVDRTVIERLIDPLTHMIRNAVDHGIETPAERLKSGKSPRGTIRVAAAHRGGRIVIEVADDGRGIDRTKLRQIAGAKGLVSASANVSEAEIDNLIFVPGFTTRDEVSELSGRGVGMDVVKNGIMALGGRIAFSSRPGQGTAFVLSLPLTLAVLDGMLVTVAGHDLIVPLTALLETIRPKREALTPFGADATMLNVRGTQIPLLDLGRRLGYRAAPPENPGVILLVEDDAGGRSGLLVDDVGGLKQVVIKSIEANYRPVDGIAGATILGDGRVALILDINGLLSLPAARNDAAGRLLAG